ncbi:MAG: nitric oxide reductase transcriptional regulator NorR [Proteobacteria bacterium]|nr:nitric oxide reductase transcriptional regulator NorR [Pseudomonadota bacterium]
MTQRLTVADALVRTALDLTASLSSEARYAQLLSAIVDAIPCDAAVLLRCDGEALRPIAVRGIDPSVVGRPFPITEHPRLKAITDARKPVLFAADDSRPDPYDGLVLSLDTDLLHVHSCMGCGLYVGQKLIGALTLDALEPDQFEDVDMGLFEGFAAMTAASMQVAELIELLEQSNRVTHASAQDLVAEALRRHGQGLVGNSESIERVRREIQLVAPSDLTVLITGETGTGKEVVARTLHAHSGRSDEPLIYINCAALPESLAESELFGHVRGAFTGAIGTRAGKFELANGGTLFLDEIGELPLSLQAKLLRALQFGEIQRLGSDEHRQVDVRVLAATNRNLTRAVKEGRFRADLFHRISVFPIHVPPLRDHLDDMPVLGSYLLDRVRIRLGLPQLVLSPPAVQSLEQYSWPGNVRELEHELSRAALRAGAAGRDTITDADIDLVEGSEADPVAVRRTPTVALRMATDAFQRDHIQAAVQARGGNWAAAARDLGLDRGNLYRTAKRLGLK